MKFAYIYIYIYIYMIKINGKVVKSNTYNGFSDNISSEEVLWLKNEILPLNPLKLFDLSTFPLIYIILSDSTKSTISSHTHTHTYTHTHIYI